MKKSLTFVVLMVLLMISCGGEASGSRNIPPASTVQVPSTPTQQLPDVFAPITDNGVTSKNKVSVLFLIDRSNSIKPDCAFADARYDVPYFIISLFQKMAQDNVHLIRFGIKFFGESADKLYLPITSASDIYLNSIDFKSKVNGTRDEENDFVDELDRAKELLNAVEDGEKIIVLISDGYLNYPHGPDGKTGVQKKIVEIQNESNIKLALFHLSCSSPYGEDKDKEAFDKSIWNSIKPDFHYSNDKSLSNITLVSGIKKLIDSTLLINYLPSGEGTAWVSDDDNEAYITVPGDMYAFKSTVVALRAENIIFSDSTGKRPLGDKETSSYKSDTFYEIEFDNTSATHPLEPVGGCVDYSIKIKFEWQKQEDNAPSGLFIGYYIVDPVEFAHSGGGSKVQIKNPEVNDSSALLWNNQHFDIIIDNKIITNESNGDIDLLQDYGRCYQVWISIPDQENPDISQVDIKKIPLEDFNNDSIDKSEFTLQNVYLPVNEPTVFTIRTDIVKFPYDNDGPEISVYSISSNIKMRFYPALVEEMDNVEIKKDRFLLTLSYATEEYYGGGHLKIYALNKSDDYVILNYCKKAQENLSVITNDGEMYYALHVEDDFYTSETQNDGRVKFDIPLTDFLQRECGYEFLLFQWDDGKDDIEFRPTVLCSREENLISCRKSEYQVVER